MLSEKIKNLGCKPFLLILFIFVLLIWLLFSINNNINIASEENLNIFSYTVKVRDTVEELDKVFERAEVNVSVMADSISNSYDASKQQDKTYNMHFIEGINGLVQSVLLNSPNVNGSWFQINADLPFSSSAYNWYEFRENQLIDVKGLFAGTPSVDRKITPGDDPYYFNAVTNQKPIWSDIYTDADTKESMMTISAPIYKDGTLVGVVGIDVYTDKLQQILKDMQSTLGSSELYLLDKKNKVILSQLKSHSNSTEDEYKFLNLFKKNKKGPIEYNDGGVRKTAIKFTLSNDYKIIIALENKTLFNDTNRLSYMLYITFSLLVISILIIFANYFWPLIKTQPIDNQPTEKIDEPVDTELI